LRGFYPYDTVRAFYRKFSSVPQGVGGSSYKELS